MAASTTTQSGSDAQTDAVSVTVTGNESLPLLSRAIPNADPSDQPKLDIDLYIQNYRGRTRFDRLMLIGKCCVPLRVEAFKAAIAEAKKGVDIPRYKEAWDLLHAAAPSEPEAATMDAEWIDMTEWTNKEESQRLDSELKVYKNNLIKESIRMGNEDMGRHLESIGQLTEAAEAYNRMRHDVSATKHIVDCGMHMSNVALQRRDWTSVLNQVGKIANVQNGDDEQSQQAYIKIVSGIALMGLGHFHDASKSFIQTDSNVSPTEYNHIASPNDVAIYGGLLALATMDRKGLQTRILENQSFRAFLEHEPPIRKAISLFVGGRYSSCLSVLESVRADYLLDIYLQPHVPAIYSRIRTKCIVQYFIPFSCATLDNLNAAFAAPGQSVDGELVKLIREGSLNARIDTKNKLLVAVRPDPRLAMQTNALGVARRYEREAKERLRRINIIAAGLEVSGAKKQASGAAGGSGLDEAWYEETTKALAYAEGIQTQTS